MEMLRSDHSSGRSQGQQPSRETRVAAERHAADALQWLIDQGIVERIETDSEYQRGSILSINIRLYRGTATQWPKAWAALGNETIDRSPFSVRIMVYG